MDLFNNAVGIETGRRMKDSAAATVKVALRDSVRAGKMQVVVKNDAGLALDCGGVVIDTVLYQGRWNIPKCLAPSNYKKK